MASARADAAQDPGDPLRPRSGRLRDAAALRQGAGRRRGPDHRADAQGDAARRLGAAAALRLRLLRLPAGGRPSRSATSASSTAAGSGRSPMCAAARTRAGAGSSTAAGSRRPTPSPTSSPAPSTWSPTATGQAGRVVAYGGSAGGMLMGAIANMRPDLWGAIIAAVPFVDVLNTMSDATLPLTPPEWPEWGNPLKDAGGLRLHRQLQPLRQRRGPALSGRSSPPAGSPTRASPGGSRRSGSRGCASTPPATAPDAAEDQHGGRPRRRFGPLRLPEGDRARLRLRRLGDRGRRARRVA